MGPRGGAPGAHPGSAKWPWWTAGLASGRGDVVCGESVSVGVSMPQH